MDFTGYRKVASTCPISMRRCVGSCAREHPGACCPMSCRPWPVVYQQSQRWIAAGCFEAIVHDLRAILRLADSRWELPATRSASHSVRVGAGVGGGDGDDHRCAMVTPSPRGRTRAGGGRHRPTPHELRPDAVQRLPELIVSEYWRRFPGVEITAGSGTTVLNVERLRSGELDIAFADGVRKRGRSPVGRHHHGTCRGRPAQRASSESAPAHTPRGCGRTSYARKLRRSARWWVLPQQSDSCRSQQALGSTHSAPEQPGRAVWASPAVRPAVSGLWQSPPRQQPEQGRPS
jgi:hypothetical protein